MLVQLKRGSHVENGEKPVSLNSNILSILVHMYTDTFVSKDFP